MSIKLSELAQKISCRLQGEDCLIDNVADINDAQHGQLAFIYNAKYLDKLATTNASAIILKKEWADGCAMPVLIAENPRLAFVKATRLLNPEKSCDPGVSDSAVIAKDVSLPESVCIGPNVVIESGVKLGECVYLGANSVISSNVKIGSNTVIYPNVTIGHASEIGKDCILNAGCVIGADGFGYERDGDYYLKIPQLGNVRIGNDVEIGANSTVDRGALHDTVINDGVKIDNLVQIGHNVVMGRHTVMSAQSGVAGSTVIGEYCLIGGGVSIRDNIEISNNVMLTGRTVVTSSLKEPGSYSSGVLVDKTVNWKKNALRYKYLNEMEKRLKALEKKLETR